MISADFSPMSAVAGGVLIGLSASLLLLMHGRIAGISGILGSVLNGEREGLDWRLTFLAGLVVSGLAFVWFAPGMVAASAERSILATVVAGLVVGVGVRMGSGCTSGHGVCGLSRFSSRSLVATVTFMGTGFVTATVIQLLTGGDL